MVCRWLPKERAGAHLHVQRGGCRPPRRPCGDGAAVEYHPQREPGDQGRFCVRPQGLLYPAGEEGGQIHFGEYPRILWQYGWVGGSCSLLCGGQWAGADAQKLLELLPSRSAGDLQVFLLLSHLRQSECHRGLFRTTEGHPDQSVCKACCG